MTNSTQSARSENVKAIVDFFKSGIKTDASSLGIELGAYLGERTVPVSYSGEHVGRLASQRAQKRFLHGRLHDQDGDILGVAKRVKRSPSNLHLQVELPRRPLHRPHGSSKLL